MNIFSMMIKLLIVILLLRFIFGLIIDAVGRARSISTDVNKINAANI